jgi:hypothetical protein
MSRKSLLVSMEITTAGRGHDCRYNKKHRIEKGVRRLTVKSDGNEHHYCLACAKIFMMGSLQRLQALNSEIDALTSPQSSI